MSTHSSSDGLQVARRLLAGALDLEEGTIDGQAQIVALQGFDSLAYERLVASVEEHLDRDVDPLMMVSVDTVADLGKVLSQTEDQNQ
jgi:acyl carrier protein